MDNPTGAFSYQWGYLSNEQILAREKVTGFLKMYYNDTILEHGR